MSQPFSARCPVGRGCTRALFKTCHSCEYVPLYEIRRSQSSLIDRSPADPSVSTQVPAITNSNHLTSGASDPNAQLIQTHSVYNQTHLNRSSPPDSASFH